MAAVDAYAYEAALEEQEEQKRLHRPIKEWFAARQDLQDAHGAFPAFWRDLAGWIAWREVKRAYNMFLEKKGDHSSYGAVVSAAQSVIYAEQSTDGNSASAVKVVPLGAAPQGIEATAPAEANGGAAQAAPEPAPARKRRRWGDSADAVLEEVVEDAGALRRRRWGQADANPLPDPGALGLGPSVDIAPPTLPPMPAVQRGRCRWGQRAISAAMAMLPPGASPMQEALFVYRVRVEEVQLKLALVPMEAKRQEADPNRSPSPEPEYDSNGKRLNNRDQRLTKRLTAERDRLLERMMDLNPALTGQYGPKYIRKLYIPWRDYPNYNFIGLIIGPRGSTQKKLEKETNCKISIRGRGSGKDAKMADGNPQAGSARNPKKTEEDDDEMHVLLTGERLAEVEQAAALISDLLHPVDDDTNEWKKRQLMELAALNGTMRDLNAPCSRCGEPGHRHYECPYAEAGARRITVRCALCGDGSHVTTDCKQYRRGGQGGGGASEAEGGAPAAGGAADVAMESEYLSFMAEMGDSSAKDRLDAISRAKAHQQGGGGHGHGQGTMHRPPLSTFVPAGGIREVGGAGAQSVPQPSPPPSGGTHAATGRAGLGYASHAPPAPPPPVQVPAPVPQYMQPQVPQPAPTPVVAQQAYPSLFPGMPHPNSAEYAAWYAHAYAQYAQAAAGGMYGGYGYGNPGMGPGQPMGAAAYGYNPYAGAGYGSMAGAHAASAYAGQAAYGHAYDPAALQPAATQHIGAHGT